MSFGGFQWPLPTEAGPGEWVVVVGHAKEFPQEQASLHGATLDRAMHFCWVMRSGQAARKAGRPGEAELYEVEPHAGYPIDIADGILRMRVGRLVRRIWTWSDRLGRLAVADAVDTLAPDAIPGTRPEVERILAVVRSWAKTGEPLTAAHDAALALAEDLATRGCHDLNTWNRQRTINAALSIITSPEGLENVLPDDLPYGGPLRERLGIE